MIKDCTQSRVRDIVLPQYDLDSYLGTLSSFAKMASYPFLEQLHPPSPSFRNWNRSRYAYLSWSQAAGISGEVPELVARLFQ